MTSDRLIVYLKDRGIRLVVLPNDQIKIVGKPNDQIIAAVKSRKQELLAMLQGVDRPSPIPGIIFDHRGGVRWIGTPTAGLGAELDNQGCSDFPDTGEVRP
jgi:hypothetical protein